MLGVIGIHVGSFALSNPQANTQLIGLLEILSRFTVPAFFFLSAFGLFYHTSSFEAFSYKDFLWRRSRVVLFPYVAWSLLYILYAGATVGNFAGLWPRYLVPTLFFGNGYYHYILWLFCCGFTYGCLCGGVWCVAFYKSLFYGLVCSLWYKWLLTIGRLIIVVKLRFRILGCNMPIL